MCAMPQSSRTMMTFFACCSQRERSAWGAAWGTCDAMTPATARRSFFIEALPKRSVALLGRRPGRPEAADRKAKDFSGPVVGDEQGAALRHPGLVFRDVGAPADTAALFTGEQDEGERPLRLPAERLDDA